LVIVLYVRLQLTDSDYPFGIFKLFLFKLVIPIIVGTVVVVIVWYLGLQIPLIR